MTRESSGAVAWRQAGGDGLDPVFRRGVKAAPRVSPLAPVQPPPPRVPFVKKGAAMIRRGEVGASDEMLSREQQIAIDERARAAPPGSRRRVAGFT